MVLCNLRCLSYCQHGGQGGKLMWEDCIVNCMGTDCAKIRMDLDSKYVLWKVVVDFVCSFMYRTSD
jgi:hypothetical protein